MDSNLPRTPQRVVDAVHVIAEYLRAMDYTEALVSPQGGVAFHFDTAHQRLCKMADIAEAKAAESDRLRSALEAMVAACGKCGGDGRVRLFNTEFTECWVCQPARRVLEGK